MNHFLEAELLRRIEHGIELAKASGGGGGGGAAVEALDSAVYGKAYGALAGLLEAKGLGAQDGECQGLTKVLSLRKKKD